MIIPSDRFACFTRSTVALIAKKTKRNERNHRTSNFVISSVCVCDIFIASQTVQSLMNAKRDSRKEGFSVMTRFHFFALIKDQKDDSFHQSVLNWHNFVHLI